MFEEETNQEEEQDLMSVIPDTFLDPIDQETSEDDQEDDLPLDTIEELE